MLKKPKKESFFKQNGLDHIDYKDTEVLKRFIDAHGRIMPRRRTALTASEQRRLAQVIKRSRYMALLPYVMR